VSCAKTAELIDLSFGLWTQVGRGNQEFSRIRQVAPMCTSSIIFVIVFTSWEGTLVPPGEYD